MNDIGENMRGLYKIIEELRNTKEEALRQSDHFAGKVHILEQENARLRSEHAAELITLRQENAILSSTNEALQQQLREALDRVTQAEYDPLTVLTKRYQNHKIKFSLDNWPISEEA